MQDFTLISAESLNIISKYRLFLRSAGQISLTVQSFLKEYPLIYRVVTSASISVDEVQYSDDE